MARNDIAVMRQPAYRGRGLFVCSASVISKMAPRLPRIYLHWLLHIRCCMHPDSTDSKQRGSDTYSPAFCYRTNIQLRGNDEAVLAQCLHASFSEQAVGGSDIPRGEGVRGVCVSVLPVTCC